MSRARPLRPSDAVGLALVAVWLVWVVVSAVLNGRPVRLGSPFVVAPLVLVAGVVVGRLAGNAGRGASEASVSKPPHAGRGARDHGGRGARDHGGRGARDHGGRGAREERAGVSKPPDQAGRGASEASVSKPSWWLDVTLIVLVTALLPGVAWKMAPGPAPLGYPNANTAAATQVLVLCGLVLLDPARDRWGRILLGVATASAAFAILHHGSIAGMVVAVPVVLLVLVTLLWRPRRVWWALLLGVGSLAAAVVAFLRLATLEQWPDAALRGLSSVRQELWQVALALWRDHPITGAGPGAFAEVNPFAADHDLAAAHSSLLQVGSELGLVGVALLGLLVLTGYVVGTRGRPALGVLASAAWTALWIHSLVDHLFDYPGLALLAGLVLGFAGSTRNAG